MFCWITVAFLLGLVLGSYLPFLPSVIFLILAFAALVPLRLEQAGRLTIQRGCLAYGSLLAGLLYWTAFAAHPPSRLVEQAGRDPARIVGTVSEPVRHAPGRSVIILAVSQLGEEPHAGSVDGRLRLTWRNADRAVEQGDEVAVTARIRAPLGTLNPGGFDYASYLQRRKIESLTPGGTASAGLRLRRLPGRRWASTWGSSWETPGT